MLQLGMRFDAPPCEQKPENQARLGKQFRDIFDLMADGCWRTLRQVSDLTGYPEASISAQLRNARKLRFGSHRVERECAGNGLHRYRLLVNEAQP